MLTIEVELLTGRYAATAHNDRDRAEWPPHPARLFSALVAALHERSPTDPDERAALLWLEQQEAPSLEVDVEAGSRLVRDVFVPVNDISLIGDLGRPLREAEQDLDRAEALPEGKMRDTEVKSARKQIDKARKRIEAVYVDHARRDDEPSNKEIASALALTPDRRTRQVRTFPVVLPTRPHFALRWPAAPPASLRVALGALLERVTYLGHSSSLVRCALSQREVVPTLVVREDGDHVLRTVGPGQLERLEREYERHRGVENRVLPARPRAYGTPSTAELTEPTARTVFGDDWIVFERVGRAGLLSSCCQGLSRAIRAALIEVHGSEDLPASLSGHSPDGKPSDQPHLAYLTLPFVAHEYADGSVMGCALVLPRGVPARDREMLLRLVAKWERTRGTGETFRLVVAGAGLPRTEIQRVELSEKATLRPSRWTRPERRFVTATPIALDRNPGDLRGNRDGEAQAAAERARGTIAMACERIGLPKPRSVAVSFAPRARGAQPARAFGPWPRKPGVPTRVLVHAELQFDSLVRGPVILGAGRFFGLGLCLPLSEDANR